MTIDRVVNNDLLMHGTREHADALRGQPEVRKVVPLLPELKVTPHFDALLPTAPANGTVSLNVRLTAYERHEHLRPVGAELAGRLTRALRERCAAAWRSRPSCNLPAGKVMAVEAHSERLAVVVPVALQDALAVAEALAHEPEVMWVEPHQEFRVFNVDGVQASQSGSQGFNGVGNSRASGTTPIWDMGLHGENEIIGVGDSGLDTGHCFFEEAQGGTPGTQNYGPDHRKVVAYRAYADGGATGQRDHGTHVVGSILGRSSTNGAAGENERGSAYAAKVSFTDIGPGDAPGLQVPNDLAGNFFNVDYDNGARIHSNSWGANVNAYTTSTVGTDQAAYDMDDLVILFAAGNSGNPDRTPSIGAPATCKNCITVGATENDNSENPRPVGVSTAHRSAPSAPSPSPSPSPSLSPAPQLTSPSPSPSPPAPGRRAGALLVDRHGRGQSLQARRDRARLLHLLGQLERGGRLPHHRDGRHLHGHAHHRRQRGADPSVPSRGILPHGQEGQRPRRQQLRRRHDPIGRSDEGDDDLGGPEDDK